MGEGRGCSAMRGRRLPFAAMTFFPPAAAFFMAFPGDFFFVTLVTLGFITLTTAAFFAVFLGAVFWVAFFGVKRINLSIRRSGLPGSLFVSERVLRVGAGTVVAAFVDFAFDF